MDSHEVRRQWADRSGEFSPAYYAYYGPDERSEAVRRALEANVGPDASVLELGCSSGRHLAHLREHGFADLAGVEVNDDAFDVMREHYPDLAAAGRFHAAAIEDVVAAADDDAYDAVYSVETLQHLHPDLEQVFEDLARVVGGVLVTVENERTTDDDPVTFVDDSVPLYHRDWGRVLGDAGFVEVATRACGRDTLRVFRPS